MLHGAVSERTGETPHVWMRGFCTNKNRLLQKSQQNLIQFSNAFPLEEHSWNFRSEKMNPNDIKLLKNISALFALKQHGFDIKI